MSKQHSNKINKLAISVSVIGVLLIILGLFLSASLAESNMRYWGAYLLSFGIGILIFYYFGTFLYFMFTKTTSLVHQLMTFYIGVTVLMIFTGLTAAIFSIPLGMPLFLAGLGMFAFLWIGVLLYFLFNQEK